MYYCREVNRVLEDTQFLSYRCLVITAHAIIFCVLDQWQSSWFECLFITDVKFLYLAPGNTENYKELVENPVTDVFTFYYQGSESELPSIIDPVINRIKTGKLTSLTYESKFMYWVDGLKVTLWICIQELPVMNFSETEWLNNCKYETKLLYRVSV